MQMVVTPSHHNGSDRTLGREECGPAREKILGEGQAAHPVIPGMCGCTCGSGDEKAACPVIPGASACGPGERQAAYPVVSGACSCGLRETACPQSSVAATSLG